MKAILAIDSFKGCLTSAQAEEAALEVFQEGEALAIPVSDGGEGFSKVVTDLLEGSFRTVRCSDPLGRPIEARYGIVLDGRVAVLETAAASGLCLLEKDERNPLRATSYGTGELIADALEEGVEEIWLGLGGSATCDGGTGMLQALGYRFITPDGILEDGRTLLGNIQKIDSSHRHKGLTECRIKGFYDVSVPFCGIGGAAQMFAPQKGAGPEMVEALDSWMFRLSGLYTSFSGREICSIPGSGAAGGLGGALSACLGASMVPGISQVLDLSGMDRALADCGLVITGEGCADLQTIRGKVPMGVLSYVRKHDEILGLEHHTRVILLAGKVENREALLHAGFDEVIQVTPPEMHLEDALRPEMASHNIRIALARNMKDPSFPEHNNYRH